MHDCAAMYLRRANVAILVDYCHHCWIFCDQHLSCNGDRKCILATTFHIMGWAQVCRHSCSSFAADLRLLIFGRRKYMAPKSRIFECHPHGFNMGPEKVMQSNIYVSLNATWWYGARALRVYYRLLFIRLFFPFLNTKKTHEVEHINRFQFQFIWTFIFEKLFIICNTSTYIVYLNGIN